MQNNEPLLTSNSIKIYYDIPNSRAVAPLG